MSLKERLQTSLRKYAVPMACFLGSFLLFTRTLAPAVYNLDSAELTTAAATLGIPRATGYPLYMLSGHLWSKIPFWNVGYCLNLYSAFCGALTILFLERFLEKVHISAPARLTAALLLATSNYFWYLSSIAEVYTLNTALMTGFLWRAAVWQQHPSRKNLLWMGLIFGLGFTHHGSALLLVPGAAWIFLSTIRKTSSWKKDIPLFIIFSGLPLLLYLYLPLRYLQSPAFNYAGAFNAQGVFVPLDLTTWNGFFQLVTGQGFQILMFSYPLPDLLNELLQFWVHIGRSFWLVGLGPGLVGAWIMARKERSLGVGLLLIFLLQMIFFSAYRVIDKQTMFLPADCIFAIWIAAGLEAIGDWLASAAVKLGRTLLYIGGFALVIFAALWNFPLVDQSQDHSTEEQTLALMNALPQGSVVIGYWDAVPPIQYFQLVEGIRPDLVPINRFLIGTQTLQEYCAWKIQTSAVYFTYYPRELEELYKVQEGDGFYYISP